MTKQEIKQLIIDSDYKNKDVVIYWRFTLNGLLEKRVVILIDKRHTIDSLSEWISWNAKKPNFKLKILEVDND